MSKLITISQLAQHKYLSSRHFGSKILVTDKIVEIKDFDSPCSIDAVSIFVCLGGEAHGSLNHAPFHLGKNMILILFKGDVIEIDSTSDLEGYAAMMDYDYLTELDLDFDKRTAFFAELRGHTQISVDSATIEMMKPYYLLAIRYIEQQSSELANILRGLVTAFCHTAVSLVYKQLCQQPAASPSRGRAVFARFVSLLDSNYRRERNVAFYASQMCITPKHLSYIIKEYSGRPALDWINERVMNECKRLLRCTTLSIKEIAATLNFASQSAFGKYFRQQLGISPKAYRR